MNDNYSNKNIFTNVLLILIFILLVIGGFKTGLFSSKTVTNESNENRIYNENINQIKEAAKDYYTIDKLPTNIGDTTKLTLKQMIDKKIVLNITDYNNNSCNSEYSYVEVTKLSNNEYSLKVLLSCDNHTDYIVTTIGCHETCNNGNCTTNTVETTKTEYQYSKQVTTNGLTSYSCPDNYTLKGNKCYKNITTTINATSIYSEEKELVTNALVNNGSSYNVYADNIEVKGNSYQVCNTGTLKNGKCVSTFTSDATKKYNCAEGSLSGSKCIIKTTNSSTVNASISSYTYGNWYVVDTYKRTSALATYNNGTEKLVDNGTTREYDCATPRYCPTKTTYYHYTLYRRTKTANYTCDNGTLSGSKCIITTSSSKTIDAKLTYSCSKGTLSGNKCIITTSTNALTKYKDSTYKCPTGYTSLGSGSNMKCYITKKNDDKYYCANTDEVLKDNKCYSKDSSKLTGYTCTDGYKLDGDKCIKETYCAKCATKAVSESKTTTVYKWSTEKSLTGYTSTGKYRVLDESGKVVKTGEISELDNKVSSSETNKETNSNIETSKSEDKTNKNEKTTSTKDYILYGIVIVGVIILAFASFTMLKIKKYNN